MLTILFGRKNGIAVRTTQDHWASVNILITEAYVAYLTKVLPL